MTKQLAFEELYVVSDLHIGDTKGSPIFDQAEELAALVDWLEQRTTPNGGSVGLVLNGDVLDTLSEAVQGYVCGPDEAERIVDGILTHAAFKPVFDSLARFCQSPGRMLVVVLGNHDLELVYPNVQELLLERLSAGVNDVRAKVVFATAGAGFRCLVGRASGDLVSVACVHGNEFDTWNAFDPETLARLLRAGTLGVVSPLTAVAPNAGTRLVRDIMNSIKAEYPFVDLLKPEMDGVFTILLALAPAKMQALPELAKTMVVAEAVGTQRVAHVLGQAMIPGNPASVAPTATTASWAPKGEFARFLEQDAPTATACRPLDRAWAHAVVGNETPESLAESGEVLGGWQLAKNLASFWLRKITHSQKEALRTALLDWGGSPSTFDLDGDCAVYDSLAEVKPNIDVVIAGHTHLRRQKYLPNTGQRLRAPLYLNTGTWIRLMQLSKADCEPERFDVVYEALLAQSMQALDALGSSTLLKQQTVAVVRPAVGVPGVEAAICDFSVKRAKDLGIAADLAKVCVPVQQWSEVKRG